VNPDKEKVNLLLDGLSLTKRIMVINSALAAFRPKIFRKI
jgi:hypothetical protein